MASPVKSRFLTKVTSVVNVASLFSFFMSNGIWYIEGRSWLYHLNPESGRSLIQPRPVLEQNQLRSRMRPALYSDFARRVLVNAMELTEKERLMLVEKKEQIRKLTGEILDVCEDYAEASRIRKKITGVLSILSTIGSYAKPRSDLNVFSTMAENIFADMSPPCPDFLWKFISGKIEKFCIYVSSIQFDFTRKDVKIALPKIDISLFRAR